MEISSTFWSLDITNFWRKQEETHSKYADHSNVAHDMISIITYSVRVEARFSLGEELLAGDILTPLARRLGNKS